MAFQAPAGKKLRYKFQFLKADNSPAKVDGTPEIQTTLGNVVETVQDTTDPSGSTWSTLIDPAGVGDGSVSGTADVDLGAGVNALPFALGDFTVAETMADHVQVGDPTLE